MKKPGSIRSETPPLDLRARWVPGGRLLAALVAGLAGGALFAWAGLPLAWLLGAMFATTLASLSGLSLEVPPLVRLPVMVVLGVLIGASFTPDRLAGILLWIPSAALLLLCVPTVGLACLLYLRRIARLAPVTAYFAAAPGGLSEMVLLSERSGADMRTVALVHTVRVLLIVSAAPFLVTLPGGDGAVTRAVSTSAVDWGELALLGVTGGAGAWAATRLGLPAAAFFGGMAASALVHLAGLAEGSVPGPLLAAAQIVLGASIGSRFRGMRAATVLRHILAGFGLTLLMFAVTFLFAAAAHLLTGLPFVALALAYVPGGVTEMGLVALALGVDPAFVATHHLVRILIVVTSAPLLLPLWRRRGGAGG